MIGQLQIQYRNWNGTGYDSPLNFQSRGVASDFGPRKFGDFWHGGIDVNGPGDRDADKYDLLIAHRSGIIVDENHVTHKTTNIRYPSIDYGNHRMVYVHTYFNPCEGGCNVNNQTITASNMLRPNTDRWATIFIIGNDTIVKGQVAGFVKFGNDTLVVSNMLEPGDPIAPLGDSGTNNYHLHLNTIPDDKETYNDAWNANPLQHITYDVPDYELKLYSQLDTGKVKIKYPGYQATSMALKVKLSNESDNGNVYNTVMDANKVVFGIKKLSESSFGVIQGDAARGQISLGGLINEDKENHPDAIKKGNDYVQLGSFGSWTVNGQDAFAYTSSTPHPWDIYYFTDFQTRIHKNDTQKPKTSKLIADLPDNSRYIDDKYAIRSEAHHINGQIEFSEIDTITLDNFKPYLSRITVNANGGTLYEVERSGNEGAVATLDDGYVSNNMWDYPLRNPSLPGLQQLNIVALTSEPMQSMQVAHRIKGSAQPFSNYRVMNSSSDSMTWQYPFSVFASLDTCIEVRFKGKDKNNNDILNIYHHTNKNTSGVSLLIPTRKRDITVTDVSAWTNPGSIHLAGTDQVDFCINGCSARSDGSTCSDKSS